MATVGNFVTAKAPENHKIQQLSTSGMQQVQYQSLRINRFQQLSPSDGIWFGTRGSEVQILSPRPIFSISYKQMSPSGSPKRSPIWETCANAVEFCWARRRDAAVRIASEMAI